MGRRDDKDYVYCNNCEKKILQDRAIYVRGRPYCETCYKRADEYGIYDEYDEDGDYNEEDDEDDDDNEDDDEDDDDDYD